MHFAVVFLVFHTVLWFFEFRLLILSFKSVAGFDHFYTSVKCKAFFTVCHTAVKSVFLTFRLHM